MNGTRWMRAWMYQYSEAVEKTCLAGLWVYEDWAVKAPQTGTSWDVGPAP